MAIVVGDLIKIEYLNGDPKQNLLESIQNPIHGNLIQTLKLITNTLLIYGFN